MSKIFFMVQKGEFGLHNECKFNVQLWKDIENVGKVYSGNGRFCKTFEEVREYIKNNRTSIEAVEKIYLWDGRIIKPWVFGFEKDPDKKFGIFNAGGYPHIASLHYEVYHEGGWGYDLANLASIIDNKPRWCVDADLLNEEERKEIENMCNRYNKR